MASSQRDESSINAAAVRERLRLYEDHNLAYKLQQEEFDSHYDRNRTERQLVGLDTRHSKVEQTREAIAAHQVHQRNVEAIAAHDALVAQQLQQEIEKEEQMFRQLQLQKDEELAKRLQEEEGAAQSVPEPSSSTQGAPIGVMLRNLNLDESTQNELNRLSDVSYVPVSDIVSTTVTPRQTTTFGVVPSHPGMDAARRPAAMTQPRVIQGVPLPGLAQPTPPIITPTSPAEDRWPTPPPLPPPPSYPHPPEVSQIIARPPYPPPPPSFVSTNPFLQDIQTQSTGFLTHTR